ncbi:MAG: DUF2399 domain-containing protein [Treponema sp.]|jgi:hypothetical protein|nr:DUF2399 domain-containing protein [Treponema sp.]
MNDWEKEIISAFISRYFASAVPAGAEERNAIRLRSLSIFPDFDAASPDEKESYLEAAEALEERGIVQLKWVKRSTGNRLKTLICADFEKLFMEADSKYPKAEAQEIRAMLAVRLRALKDSVNAKNKDHPSVDKVLAFMNWFADHFDSQEIGRGLNQKTVAEFVRVLELFLDMERMETLTTRALSIELYHDSKRLENLVDFFALSLSQAEKNGVPVPDFSFIRRSYPETLIAGKIVFEYPGQDSIPPLVNATGRILGLPLRHAVEIQRIRAVDGKENPLVLTVENKETFYIFTDIQKRHNNKHLSKYDCFLYIGGYPNQAATAMIRVLAASGFVFHHAGDLDPDGLLIFQSIADIAARPVTPVHMNAAVFDRYLPWARQLTPTMVRQLVKIREDTRAVPGLSELLHRIEETRRGVEQEIIDYRN